MTTELPQPDKTKLKGSKHARATMARLAAVQCVYQWLYTRDPAAAIIDRYFADYAGEKLEEETGDELLVPDRELLMQIVSQVETELQALEERIASHLNSSVDRQKDLLIQSILLCGTAELTGPSELDPPIIIADYLHVTRAFYEGSEIKLINGVLDQIYKTS